MTFLRRTRRADDSLMRSGSARGARYIDVLRDRGGYCLRILAHAAQRNEFGADSQEYVRDRIHRYDYSISQDPPNDEADHEYGPTKMPGNGYDTYEERSRTASTTGDVWCVWVLEISISDSRISNMCARFDWRVGIFGIFFWI